MLRPFALVLFMFRFVHNLARLFALLGGFVLAGLIVLTCLSIAGRSINSILHSGFLQSVAPDTASLFLASGVGPINGDFELVEAGMAFTIFAFLSLCQLNGSHASVDIFTSSLGPRVQQWLRTIIEIVFAAILVLIAWQLFEGMESKRRSGQTSFLLEMPVWWAYATSLLACAVATFVAVYVAVARIIELTTGRLILPPEMEASH